MFTRKNADVSPIDDPVFTIARMAKNDKSEDVINGTIGSLYNEDFKLVALDSVFDTYNKIDNIQKAKYAENFTGNLEFKKDVYKWIFNNINIDLKHEVIATPGGSGSISLSIKSILDKDEYIILPSIGWTSYKLMASQNELKYIEYELFNGDKFNIESFKSTIDFVSTKQDKIVLVINDPCHNPTGYSLTIDEWKKIIEILNEYSLKKPVVLINDIAYIDYSYNLKNSRNYLKLFNKFSDNILAIISFSCSKSLTSYGLRCGASILLSKNIDGLKKIKNVMDKNVRSIWSSIPNAAMVNFSEVINNNYDKYMEEKDFYINLLKERSDLFLKEAKDNNLDIYPYKEGFFITIKEIDNKKRDNDHKKLLDNHIYTVKVNYGIRIAICSIPLVKVKGLAKKVKDIIG